MGQYLAALAAIFFAVSAGASQVLPRPASVALSRSEITYEQGVKGLVALGEWAKKQPSTSQKGFNLVHNIIFLKTHIARLKTELTKPRSAIVRRLHSENLARLSTQLQKALRGENDLKEKPFKSLAAFSPEDGPVGFSSTLSKTSGGGLFPLYPMENLQIHRPLEELLKVLNIDDPPTANKIETSGLEESLKLSTTGTITGVDLSDMYPSPELQLKSKTEKSNACFAFALASDLAFELGKSGANSFQISAVDLYRRLRDNEDGRKSEAGNDCGPLDPDFETHVVSGQWRHDLGIYDIQSAYDFVKNVGACLRVGDSFRRLKISGVEKLDSPISSEQIRSMILAGRPPMILIDREERSIVEDWYRIKPGKGRMDHMLVVVGFGNSEINPITLKREPYFIVRDSLVDEPIHYKVSAEDLVSHALSLEKVSALRPGY